MHELLEQLTIARALVPPHLHQQAIGAHRVTGIGEQHLQRYATEFDFRWNLRKTTDKERAEALLSNVAGKRLQYRRPAAEV